MATSLFLNKTQVDLYEKRITRKIQIGEVSEVASRKSSFSYTIKIPKTSNNKRIFEMLGTIGNTSRKPFEQINADYVIDSIYLVENGSAIIRDCGKDYSVNIIDGVKSLSDLLSGKKISDLPLSDLDHILTTQTYIDSYQNTSGYIYGIANYGLGVTSNLKVEKQAPSIFVHTLFKRIFESNGLTLIGEFFTTNDKYLNEIITPAKGYTVEDSAFASISKGNVETDILSRFELLNEFEFFEEKFTISDIDLTEDSVVNGEIVFANAGTYKIDLDSTFNIFNTSVSIVVKINGIGRSYVSLDENQTSNQSSLTFTAQAGDIVSFWIQGASGEFEEGIEEFPYSINYSISIDAELFLQDGGQLIQASDYIGDINQLDFIKDVVNRYGLVLRPIRSATDFEFKRLEVLLNDRETAEDWTEKLSEKTNESFVSGYAKINYAKYQYPKEIVVPNNDGEFIIDNENANNEAEFFQSPFEIPITSGSVAGETTYLIPVWSLEDSEVKNEETPLKVMHINRVDTSITAKLFDEVTGITETENIPFLNLDFISLQYFVSNFYKAFQSLINNYKSVDFLLNLSVIDIFNLDFFKLKYMKQTGRFYYLNSVQHTPGKLSKVNMIEIAEFPQNQPPSQIGNFSFDMNHGTTRTITLANLTTGYEDPEQDAPYKVKIIDGFNANLVMKQNGVVISSETEILVEDLALTVEDAVGGTSPFSESWTFAIADIGSKTYGTETGIITANVLEYINTPPVADAGEDKTVQVPFPVEEQPLELFGFSLNGSGSFDNTGEIVSWFWKIISSPFGSDAVINQITSNPLASLTGSNEIQNIGDYTCRLTVTDEFGATDTDEMTATVEYITPTP